MVIAQGRRETLLKERVQTVVLVFLILALISPRLIFNVQALPAAILRVSLPDGTLVGPDSDPWLSEGWLLNLEGETQTFVVRINNTSASQRSYDTHLVIALNDAGYSNLISFFVNGGEVPKIAFRYGTPTPYNMWTWPSGDVYPTWFNDTLGNVGTIQRRGFKEITVSVTFSNVTGARMHFDAWGKRVAGSLKSNGDITHNPLSADSTVLFGPGQPQPQPPYAAFSFTPTFPEVGEIVTFNASSSYDPDGTIASYTWDFGDGTLPVTENDPITTHNYAALGDREVAVTVTDNDGLNGTAVDIIPVCQLPVASFVFSPPDPLEHETVTFDALSSTPDGGTIIGYKWDFGDGNITTVSAPIITHAYAAYGNYIVTLNVTDSEGKWDTESTSITVERLPLADFTWLPLYPEVYEIVTFNASYSTPDGGVIVGYEWDFGDGTPNVLETDPVITHCYTAAGDYTVTLNLTDSEDRWDSESKIITVARALTYTLTISPSTGGITDPSDGTYTYTAGTNVEVTALPDAGYRFDHWILNDSPAGSDISINILMNSDHNLEAVFAETHTLTINVSEGGTTGPTPGTYTYETPIHVVVEAIPFADYVLDHWEFDDENIGSENPVEVYVGSSHTLHAVFAYSPPPPPPSVSISPPSASILVDYSVTFTSTVSGGTSPYTYQWYLDDNPVSGENASSWTFTPTSTGAYYVYLKVTDANNNTAQSGTAMITVTSVPVGGYSVSLIKPVAKTPLIGYTLLLLIFGAIISLIKRKRK